MILPYLINSNYNSYSSNNLIATLPIVLEFYLNFY